MSKKSEQSLGNQIDALIKLRNQKREAEAVVKDLEEKFNAMMADVQAALESAGLEKASGTLGTASIKKSVVPSVQDWDKFYAFIKKGNLFHLLERRAAAAAYREQLELRKNKPIPGVVSFEKTTVGLTTS